MAKFREQFLAQVITLIIGAFSFVAALSWNNAIQNLINNFVPSGNQLGYNFITAVIVTFVAVIVIYVLSRYKK